MKNEKLVFILIFILTTLVFGCSDDETISCEENCFDVEGYVIDTNNDVGIEATINIDYIGAVFFDSDHHMGTVSSDENGFFSFSFVWGDYRDEPGTIAIVASQSGYISSDHDLGPKSVPFKGTSVDFPHEIELLVWPEAEINAIVNVNSTDITSYSLTHKFNRLSDGHIIDLPKDTILKDIVGGDQLVESICYYKKSNETIFIRDSIYVEKGEIKTYTIDLD